nr:MAG TPA: hypothetical protein [Caudoviricetes sp.]
MMQLSKLCITSLLYLLRRSCGYAILELLL